jgi:hypothetical protein
LQKGKQVYIIVSHFTFFFRLYEEKFGSQWSHMYKFKNLIKRKEE